MTYGLFLYDQQTIMADSHLKFSQKQNKKTAATYISLCEQQNL